MAKKRKKKKRAKKPAEKKKAPSRSNNESGDSSVNNSELIDEYMSDFGRKLLMTLIGILVAYLIVYVGTMVRNNVKEYRYIGQEKQQIRTIAVQGVGEVEANPDVAETNIGMTATASTTKAAQEEVNKTMSDLIAGMKELGVKADDIQTQEYNVREEYEYSDGEREKVGYRVTQGVKVKIRDLSKASEILSLATEVGANQVGGLQFDIEEPEELKQKARKEAIKNAQEKAKKLSQSLDVDVVKVISYNESFPSGPITYMEKTAPMGRGGDSVSEPSIEPGSQEVKVNVNITYEIR